MSIQSVEMPHANAFRIGLVGLVGTLIALIAFSGALLQLVDRWSSQEEYSHGFLIPIVAGGLFWLRRDALQASVGCSTWAGPIMLLVATVMLIIGEIGAIPHLSQIGFVVALAGLVLGLGGYPLLQATIFPILFLLFAIPIPHSIDFVISLKLQLVSSQLGAFFIRLFGIPVYLDGNVLDLGYYKIQVVEACSGLRYIYPLLSLSFLVAYFFRAPLWQRAVVVLSVVPITIVMNSIRIGLVGITMNYWGPHAADGILHLFEGWFVFLVCACILALEIYVLARISKRRFSDVFSLPKILYKRAGPGGATRNRGPLGASLFILCFAAVAAFHISARSEIIPDRTRFVSFPERIGPWQGHAFLLDADIERIIKPDDYLLSDYKALDGKVVNFYVAYYASQRTINKPHSPGECIPANGWNITSFRRIHYIDGVVNWPLNRVVIQKGATKQLVYYWFDERGRKVANEYLAKWYLHADAIVMNRTDGALVRLVTQFQVGESEYDADRRLQAFIHDAVPTLSVYLPSGVTSPAKSVSFGPKSPQT